MTRTLGRFLRLGTAVAVFVAAGWALVASSAGLAAAAPEPAWARAIKDGVTAQDREISRTSIGAVVLTLENKSSRNPDDLVTLYLLARAYAKKGSAKDALQTYGDVLKKDPGVWFAWHDRGILAFRPARVDPSTGKVEPAQDAQAISDLGQAIALKPDYVQALQDLAEIHLRAIPPRATAAIPLLKQALDVDPGLDTARMQLVQALSAGGDHKAALETLRPLLAREPLDPRVRMVQGSVLAAMGNIADAQAIFKRLAIENKESPDPLREWLRVTKKAPTFDRDETIWFLEKLRRLTPGAKEKAELTEYIQKLKSAVARPAGPTGPPTAAQLAAALRGADAKVRREVLQYLASSSPDRPRIEGELFLALIERLDPGREPDPKNRLLVLNAFEGMQTSSGEPPGRAFAALVRSSLLDPDADVRQKTPDILSELKNRAAIPALLMYAKKVEKDDGGFVVISARNAIYELAGDHPQSDAGPEAQTPEAQAKAFSQWWAAPERAALKRAIVQDVLSSTDFAPEKMLIWLAVDDDTGASIPAYHALLQVVDTLPQDPPTVAPELRAALQHRQARAAWLRAMPRYSDGDLLGEKRGPSVKALVDWYEKAPR